MKVEWLPVADRNRESQLTYIGERNPQAAIDIGDAIEAAVSRVAVHPHIGHPGRIAGTRELVVSGPPSLLLIALSGKPSSSCVCFMARNGGPPRCETIHSVCHKIVMVGSYGAAALEYRFASGRPGDRMARDALRGSSRSSLSTALKQVDQEFETVSASLRVPFYRTFFRVTLPVCLPAVLDIAMYLFVNALTTVSAVVFLYSPQTTLASIAVLNMDDAGDVAPAAAMAMTLFFTAVSVRILYTAATRRLLARSQAWRLR